MTEEEYLSLPEEKPYLEYVDGVVLQKPMANLAHATLAGELCFLLGLYAREHGGAFGPEGRVRVGDLPNYRLPDVSYWALGKPRGNDTAPTLGIEIRSPGQTMVELREKCRDFRRGGIDACWIIDPGGEWAETFEGDREAERVPKGGVLRSEFLPGFEVSLAELFDRVKD
jgi:Uma2 family endonuclease